MAFIAVALTLCGGSSETRSANAASKDECATNLTSMWWLLKDWVGDGDTFPPGLSSLAESATNLDLFICSGSGRRAPPSASITNVDAWSDYIYVANQRDTPPDMVPLLISPPENHGGHYGYVVWNYSSKAAQLPASRIRALVVTPWCMETNATELQLQMLKEEIVVRVPDHLRKFYPNPYRAKGAFETTK